VAHPASTRRLIDAGFAIALLAAGALAVHAWTRDEPPAMPDGICVDTGSVLPTNDGARIEVAALFGQLEPGDPDRDPALASVRFLTASLEERGYRRAGDRYEHRTADGAVISIDILGPSALRHDDLAATGRAIDRALHDHAVVYYNGHSYDGGLRFEPAGTRRLLVLDACWSTQLYGERLVDANLDVIGNTERSITGSVESLLHVLDGLEDQRVISIAAMNAAATDRAERRRSSEFPEAEHYGVLARCR